MAETTRSEKFEEFHGHARAAREAWLGSWRSLIPDTFWEQRRTARREMLLAVRSLIDGALERLEEKPAPKRKTTSRRKVKVEAAEAE
jgi:hypothetical protein